MFEAPFLTIFLVWAAFWDPAIVLSFRSKILRSKIRNWMVLTLWEIQIYNNITENPDLKKEQLIWKDLPSMKSGWLMLNISIVSKCNWQSQTGSMFFFRNWYLSPLQFPQPLLLFIFLILALLQSFEISIVFKFLLIMNSNGYAQRRSFSTDSSKILDLSYSLLLSLIGKTFILLQLLHFSIERGGECSVPFILV